MCKSACYFGIAIGLFLALPVFNSYRYSRLYGEQMVAIHAGLYGVYTNYCKKKLNSLKHLVRTTVAESHNKNSKYEKGAIT